MSAGANGQTCTSPPTWTVDARYNVVSTSGVKLFRLGIDTGEIWVYDRRAKREMSFTLQDLFLAMQQAIAEQLAT